MILHHRIWPQHPGNALAALTVSVKVDTREEIPSYMIPGTFNGYLVDEGSAEGAIRMVRLRLRAKSLPE